MKKVKLESCEVLSTRFDPDDTLYLRLITPKEREVVTACKDEYLWLEAEFDQVTDNVYGLDGPQRVAVEAYYCGFLAYYDQQARSGLVHHDVFFDWTIRKDGAIQRSVVSVYIFPAPLKEGKWEPTFSSKKGDALPHKVGGPFEDFLNSQATKKAGGGMKVDKVQLAPSPTTTTTSSTVSDPPTPQGPPPPPTS